MEYAQEKGVKLLFLLSYYPNLNLIERLWKFVKKNALNNRYYSDFKDFKEDIVDCLNNIGVTHISLKSSKSAHEYIFQTTMSYESISFYFDE